MARRKLPIDATIQTVLPTLSKPLDYVRGILEQMIAYRKIHGSAQVRIGTTGRGIAPHYRLDPISTSDEMLDDFVEGGDRWSRYYQAYAGRNHRQFDWTEEEMKTEHWSKGATSLEEIQKLIGDIRASAKTKRK